MQKALLHKKLNYIRDYKKINEMECSFEGLDNVLQSNEKMDFDVCNFLSEKEQRVLKLHFKGKLTYKEMLEDNLSGLGMVLPHELNGVLVLSVGVLINVDIYIVELYLNLQVVKQMVYRGLKLVDFGKKEVIYQNHGDIIFFDWESDGTSDHVGIVEKCENEKVYTIEENSNDDMCRQHLLQK